MPWNRIAMLATCAIFSALGAFGQSQGNANVASPSAKTPVYDVVSIRPNNSGGGGMSFGGELNGYYGTNVTLENLIQNAYGVRDDQIRGGPGWINSDKFDFRAKAVDADESSLKTLTREQRQSMLQAVLADRFHLRTHTETKIDPVYDLVIAKNGPKFKEVTASEQGKSLNGVSDGGMTWSNSSFAAHDVSLSLLANNLAYQLHRTVIDKTGLTGKYDLKFTWEPDNDADEASDTSILTVLQEQLGLKLQSAKGPVEVLVIDHVEPPSPN